MWALHSLPTIRTQIFRKTNEAMGAFDTDGDGPLLASVDSALSAQTGWKAAVATSDNAAPCIGLYPHSSGLSLRGGDTLTQAPLHPNRQTPLGSPSAWEGRLSSAGLSRHN